MASPSSRLLNLITNGNKLLSQLSILKNNNIIINKNIISPSTSTIKKTTTTTTTTATTTTLFSQSKFSFYNNIQYFGKSKIPINLNNSTTTTTTTTTSTNTKPFFELPKLFEKKYYSYIPPTWEEKDKEKQLNSITSTKEEEDNEESNKMGNSCIKDAIVWVNHLYPIKVSRLDFRSLFFHIPITKKLNSLFPSDVKIISIEKRIKEGGAYIHFQYDSSNPEYKSIEMLMSKLKSIFAQEKKHFHFASRPAKCKLVYGRPFVEDIDYRFPSTTLKITFKGSEMSPDDLFRLMRPYGHIKDIHYSSPLPSKDGPRQAIVSFKRMEGAIATRNCLHNKYFPEFNTSLYMDYEQLMRINKLKEQFSKHPKIMIPLLGILATLLTLLLFNPLREYFINKKLSSPCYFGEQQEEDDWQERSEQKVLQTHFNFPPNSIVMISAPKGSGKSSLIDKVLENRVNTLLIDCNQEVNNNDEEFIESFSKDIGFFPSYSLYSSFGSVVDAIIPTGKGAFHSTTNYQMQTILKLLDEVLAKKAKQFPLDPHQPFEYPLIVIDGFFGMIQAMESKEKANIIMDSVIQWAITSTQRGHSHVVFLSSDSFAGDIIKKYLDNRGGGQISTIQLGDVQPWMAINYIKKRIGPNTPITQHDMELVVDNLGGRYYDLNVLSQRMIAGDNVERALSNMISKAVSEIRAEGFGLSKRNDESKMGGTKLKWSRPQLWETIKKIAENDFVSYDDLLFNVFLGDETSLNNLISSNLLRFQNVDNERKVTAYSPLYCSAFKQMVNDLEFNVGMDILVQKARIEEELSKLSKVEDELLKIKNLTSKSWFEPLSIKKRRILLEDKLKDHVAKIEHRENILKKHSLFQKFIREEQMTRMELIKKQREQSKFERQQLQQQQQQQSI
ncbi:hypothetical protein ACTA71_008022 [Dictyostelium dimigraforme]